MSNPEHVAIVLKGPEAIGEWRKKNPDITLDLSGACLWDNNLSGANLRSAYLRGAYMRGAYLNGADMRDVKY